MRKIRSIPNFPNLLRLAPGGGQAFGFEGSVGAARGHEDFKSFEGLREGFRRL